MLFRAAEMQGSSGPRPADDSPLPRRHVPAGGASCPTARQVAASPWARSCYHVTKACVDQGWCGPQGAGSPLARPAAPRGAGPAWLLACPLGCRCARRPPALPGAGSLVLFDASAQPRHAGSRQAPTFAAEDGYGQFTLAYQNGVRNKAVGCMLPSCKRCGWQVACEPATPPRCMRCDVHHWRPPISSDCSSGSASTRLPPSGGGRRRWTRAPPPCAPPASQTAPCPWCSTPSGSPTSATCCEVRCPAGGRTAAERVLRAPLALQVCR